MADRQHETDARGRTPRDFTTRWHKRPERARDPLVDFAIRWVHFGGGSAEDIFVSFGIEPGTYFERLRNALAASDVEPVLRNELSLVVDRRLRDAAATKSGTRQ